MAKDDDHDLLLRIDERTGFIQEHLQAIDNRCELYESKTDSRIGKLEGWRNKHLGAYGVITAILAFFGAKLFNLI